VSFAARAHRLKHEHGRSDGVAVTVAADFLHGGEPAFARIFDRRGSRIATVHRPLGEAWTAFVARARAEAGKMAEAVSLFIGGLPDAESDAAADRNLSTADPPRGAVFLPGIALHPSQVEALGLIALIAGSPWSPVVAGASRRFSSFSPSMRRCRAGGSGCSPRRAR
jgi:hypothetical protein